MKHFLLASVALAALSLGASAERHLYIDNQTGWAGTAYAYLHNDPISLWPMGKWPGKAPDAKTVTVNGVEYSDYVVPDAGDNATVWIVLNDNAGGHTIPDTRLDLYTDLYLRAADGAITQVDPNGGKASGEFASVIEKLGGITDDLSASKKIAIDEPRLAYVNFTGFDRMPETKDADLHGWVEFFDGNGRYFRKRAITAAQGNSSLLHPKKNIKVDFCEDEWEGDDTPDISFGNWVKQDGFHLKSYFTDYFRGVAAVSYSIFDDIIADRGDMAHPWQRAGVEDADPKALCHPQGFPVAVYLNGRFYGIFSWQLKKHRKNMGMDKKNPCHIHLDGTIFFFYDNLNWKDFEVRNPKTLYTKEGAKYDGDNPTELMGEDSPAYDASNPDHVNTAKVKKSILALTRYCDELSRMRNSGASAADIRAEFEKRFDLQGLIDYTIFSSIVNNADGWYKNWQFITYDGVKWFIEPYDLDMTFGNMWNGYFVTPAEYITCNNPPYTRFMIKSGPAEFLHDYYAAELDARYAELRDKGTITPEGFKAKIRDWYDRFGAEYYDLEYQAWPQSMCIRDMIVDDNWEWTGDWVGYSDLKEWNNQLTYEPGDKCTLLSMIFKAKKRNKNSYPVRQTGYRDSFERINGWIDRRFDLQDFYWNYDLSKDPFASIDTPAATEPASREVVAVYSISGQRLESLRRGVNIVRYADGHAEKIIVK